MQNKILTDIKEPWILILRLIWWWREALNAKGLA